MTFLSGVEQLGGLAIFLNIIFLVIGVLLLIKGADIFVMSSSSIAKRMKVSPLIIGLTIVSFGTSAPELAVSVAASLKVAPGATADIAMGNVVGSNIMNLLVVLGASAVITPIAVKKGITKREFPFLIISSLLLLFLAFDVITGGNGVIQRLEAVALLVMLGYFIYILIRGAIDDKEEVEEQIIKMPIWKAIVLLVLGLAGIVVGAEFVTTPATSLATDVAIRAGLDQSLVTTLVALTVVAVGTSLPELVTSIMAAKRGENEIALGNVIGSNIFNILFIVGIAGSITPLGVNGAVLIDIVIMTAVTILVFVLCCLGHKITRKKGVILLGCYVAYLVYIIIRTVAM